MRKRWKFDPWPWILLWVIGGFIGLLVVAGLTDGCEHDNPNLCGINGPMSTATVIEGLVWLGPFVVAALGAFLFWTVPTMAKTLWEALPRRIEEPVVEDLREIHPPPE